MSVGNTQDWREFSPQSQANQQTDFEDDFDDLEFDEEENGYDVELAGFVEKVHEELYFDHKLSEVIELFATLAAVARKFGDPFENESAIRNVLLQSYSQEESDELIETMQLFQDMAIDRGIKAEDGSVFKMQTVSERIIDRFLEEANLVAAEEDEEEEELASAV